MLGAPFAAILSDRYGRRKAMFTGAVVIVIGMIIMVTSKHVAQFVVGRFVLGAAISLMTVAAPAYSMEVAPPSWRSRATGLYNCEWQYRHMPPADLHRWMVRRLRTGRSHHVRHQLRRLQPAVASPCHSASGVCSDCHGPRLLRARVAPLPDRKRSRRGGACVPDPLPRQRQPGLAPRPFRVRGDEERDQPGRH